MIPAVSPIPTQLQGVILIGGKSSRMGSPKQLLDINGRPMGERLAGLLNIVTRRPPLLLGAGPVWPQAAALTRIPDRQSSAGPLAALLGLFDARPACDFLILACDLPVLTQTALRWLLCEAAQSRADVVWPRRPDREHGEPLAAVYRATVLPQLESAWSDGVRGLIRAVPMSQRCQPLIPNIHLDAFSGANDPQSLARLLNHL